MAIYRGPGGSGDATTDSSTQAAAALAAANEAEASKIAAANSAAQASVSATNAGISASSAATSSNNAQTYANNSASSATDAETAQAAAELAQTNAETAQTAAELAETNAETAETNANASAALAQDWATKTTGPVAGSEYSSKYNAQLSAASAVDANNAKTAAQSAQTGAEAARDATLAAYDSFDDRYLGAKSSNPTVDNDGNALLAGSLYYNTTVPEMRVYTGSAWVAAYVSGAGVLLVANNLSDVASVSTARTNLGLGTAATTNSTAYATAAQGANADTAYGWGNHASAGYQPGDADLTAIGALSGTSGFLKKTAANTWSLDTSTYLTSYTETDPIYTASSWYSTTNNASNWNTAYGWGNHASAGYASTSGSYANPSWITSLDDGKVLPSMTGNTGKYLTTDGTDSSWATVDALPSQTGNSGKYLTTNGTVASWATINITPALDDLSDVTITSVSSGQVLSYNGSAWVNTTASSNTTTKGLYEHSNAISANYTIGTGNNAMSVGPLTIASGVTVTVPSGSN